MADPYDELFQDDRGPLDDLHDEEHGLEPHVETDLYFYHPDHLGTTSFVTQSFGEVSQHVEYFAFGETFLEEHNNTTHRTPYLFNAKELDEETGLYYYGARYYDPVTSIWVSVDPVLDKYFSSNKDDILNIHDFSSTNISVYSYVNNNPIKYTDPKGEYAFLRAAGPVIARLGGAIAKGAKHAVKGAKKYGGKAWRYSKDKAGKGWTYSKDKAGNVKGFFSRS